MMEGDLKQDSELTMQYTNDVLLNYTFETYNFINQFYPQKINKKNVLRRKEWTTKPFAADRSSRMDAENWQL